MGRHGLYNTTYRLTDIDTHCVAPMFGFKDSMDYYTQSRINGKLHKITACPKMFLQSWDDVLMTPESFPQDEVRKSPNLLLAMTNTGGHCCHLTPSSRSVFGFGPLDLLSWFFPSSSWFAEPIMDFINTIGKEHV